MFTTDRGFWDPETEGVRLRGKVDNADAAEEGEEHAGHYCPLGV